MAPLALVAMMPPTGVIPFVCISHRKFLDQVKTEGNLTYSESVGVPADLLSSLPVNKSTVNDRDVFIPA